LSFPTTHDDDDDDDDDDCDVDEDGDGDYDISQIVRVMLWLLRTITSMLVTLIYNSAIK
jgi:hypothetical protein